jgi:hypothetical protein
MPSVHVNRGDRTLDVFILNWPFGSLTTVPLAFSVHGEGVVPPGVEINGLPVPHAKSEFRPAGKTGTLTAQLNAAPGMEGTPVFTA